MGIVILDCPKLRLGTVILDHPIDDLFLLKKIYMIFSIMFNYFRFCLDIFTTHLTFICLKCLFHMENHINVATTAQC